MGKPVVHFEVGCRDKEKTAEFYKELFDWKTSTYGPYAEKIDTQSDKGISGHITALGHEPHNYVMMYIEVDDIQAHLDKVEKLGGKTVIPMTDIPGGGQFAWFNDPEGNLLGLHKSQES